MQKRRTTFRERSAKPAPFPLYVQRNKSNDLTADGIVRRGVGEFDGGSVEAGSAGRRVDRRSSGSGGSRMTAETKAWYGRSGRSFLQEILSCLLDGSCKGEREQDQTVRSPPRPASVDGHREHRHLQPQPQPQPLYHPHHHRQQQQPGITKDDEANRLLSYGRHGVQSSMMLAEPEDDDDAGRMKAKAHGRLPAAPVVGHRQACRHREVEETRCLNGGQCFAVEFHSSLRRSGCSCLPSWSGLRCEQRYVDPNQWGFEQTDDGVKMAAVGYSTTLFVLTMFFVWFLLHTFVRCRRSKMRKQSRVYEPSDGLLTDALQHCFWADGDVGRNDVISDRWRCVTAAEADASSFALVGRVAVEDPVTFGDPKKSAATSGTVQQSTAHLSPVRFVLPPSKPPTPHNRRFQLLPTATQRSEAAGGRGG